MSPSEITSSPASKCFRCRRSMTSGPSTATSLRNGISSTQSISRKIPLQARQHQQVAQPRLKPARRTPNKHPKHAAQRVVRAAAFGVDHGHLQGKALIFKRAERSRPLHRELVARVRDLQYPIHQRHRVAGPLRCDKRDFNRSPWPRMPPLLSELTLQSQSLIVRVALENALVRHYGFEIVVTVPSTFVSLTLNFSL
jgi:hypothetical protein